MVVGAGQILIIFPRGSVYRDYVFFYQSIHAQLAGNSERLYLARDELNVMMDRRQT